MVIQYEIIDNNLLEKLCKLIQKEIPTQRINLDFKDVLEIVYIKNQEYHFSPFEIEISSTQLYDYLFVENEQGIDNIWILLVLKITFDSGDFILVDRVKEIIEFKIVNIDVQNKILKLLMNAV